MAKLYVGNSFRFRKFTIFAFTFFCSLALLVISCKNEQTDPFIDNNDNVPSSSSSSSTSSAASSSSLSSAASSSSSSIPAGGTIGVFSDIYGTNYYALTSGNGGAPLTTSISVGSGNGLASAPTTSLQMNLPKWNSGGLNEWHEVRIEGTVNVTGNELTGTSTISFWLKPDADSSLQIVLQTSATTGGSFNAKTYFGSGGLPAINVVANVWTNITFTVSGTQVGQYFRRLDLQNVGGNNWASAILDELVIKPTAVSSSSSASSSSSIASSSSSSFSSSVSSSSSMSSSVSSSSSSVSSDPTPSAYLSGKIPNAKYIGRWDTSGPDYDKAYWPGTYMKVRFTGTTAKIEIDSGNNWCMGFAYSIDGAPLTYVKGPDIAALSSYGNYAFNLTPTPLANGTHTLKIASGNGQDVSTGDEILSIKGLILDGGASTLAPILGKHVEFIGDSITMGWGNVHEQFDSYAWLIGHELGVEHSSLARSGIATSGMNTAYQQTCYAGNTSPWNFATYHPDVVFINLGQNDGCVNQATYTTLLTTVRQKHPDAWILCMVPFNSSVNSCSMSTITAAVTSKSDAKMAVVDGKGTMIGLINGVDYHDSVELHPNVSGNRKAANYFKPIVQSYLNQ